MSHTQTPTSSAEIDGIYLNDYLRYHSDGRSGTVPTSTPKSVWRSCIPRRNCTGVTHPPGFHMAVRRDVRCSPPLVELVVPLFREIGADGRQITPQSWPRSQNSVRSTLTAWSASSFVHAGAIGRGGLITVFAVRARPPHFPITGSGHRLRCQRQISLHIPFAPAELLVSGTQTRTPSWYG